MQFLNIFHDTDYPPPKAAHPLLNCSDDQKPKSASLNSLARVLPLTPNNSFQSQFSDNQILTSLPLVPHTWVCNSPLWVQPSGLLAAEGNHGSFQPIGLFLFLQKRREGWSDGSGCSPCLARSTMGKGILEFKGMHPGVSLSFALLTSYLWKVEGSEAAWFHGGVQNGALFSCINFTVTALNSCTMRLIRCRKIHWVIFMFEGGSRGLAQGSIWSQKLLDSSPYMEVPWPGPSLWQIVLDFYLLYLSIWCWANYSTSLCLNFLLWGKKRK